jgi:NTE family protein
MKGKIGLVLSGGGTKGIAEAGVLQFLEEKNIHPEVIAGTSAGAIVGGLYAFGKSPNEILDFFKSVYFFNWKHFTLTKPGFINSDIFRLYLKPIIGEIKIKDLKKELVINATDLIQGETFVFSGDDYLLDAIIASCSVPGLASPFKKDELLLSDGGILNNFPTNLIKEKCDKIIGIYVCPLQDVKNNQLNSIKAVATRAYELLSYSVENYKFKDCDWLISPKDLSNYGMFESNKTRMEELFLLGYSEAEKTFSESFLTN